MNINVPENVIRRLPRYLRLLYRLSEEGVTNVSSAELGRELGFTPSQIRQDFSHFGKFGQQGYGYNVDLLRREISVILGMDRGYKAVLIGAGNLGKALMCNFSFEQSGVEIVAAFDANPAMTGRTINGIAVYDISQLSEYAARSTVNIAVLCVPKSALGVVTNLIAKTEINSVWNFTNQELSLPENVIVENIHFSDSLLTLGYRLSDSLAVQ